MGIVEEEADEAIYWMELLIESGLVREKLLTDLIGEADEIIAIVVSSIKTAKRNKSKQQLRGKVLKTTPHSAFPIPHSAL